MQPLGQTSPSAGRSVLWAVAVFALAFLSFRFNLFAAASDAVRATFAAESDRLVFDALRARTSSLGELTNGVFVPYLSHVGAQAILYRPLLILHPDAPFVLALFNSTALAAMVAALGLVVMPILGAIGASALALSLILSPWLIAFSTSAYWASWTWFLPLLIATIAAPRASANSRAKFLLAAMLFPAFLLRFSIGYEYASTIVLAALAPLVYHDLSRQVCWRPILKSLVCVMTPAVAAFACAIALHAAQISNHGKDGLREIAFLVTKRLYADDPHTVAAAACTGVPAMHIADCRQAYVRSLEASTPVVLASYATFRRSLPWLGGPDIIDAPALMPLRRALRSMDAGAFIGEIRKLDASTLPGVFNLALTALICWAAIFWLCLLLWRRGKSALPYAGMMAVAALAPLSWLILAKPHSYAHQHLSFVLWSIPFLPFLAGCLVAMIRSRPKRG